MLRELYAPTDFVSEDKDPFFTPEEKLALIDQSAVHAWQSVINGKPYNDQFHVALPFVTGGTFSFGLKKFPEIVFTDYINVGDEQLYRNGIGARLLKAALRHSVGLDERVREFHTGWARLGLINTAVCVLGEENVGVESGGKSYGWGSDHPLSSVLDDFPPEPGEPYLVFKISAKLNRDEAMSWESPIKVLAEAQND